MEIIPIDCNYVEAEFASSYLLIKNKRGLFVECNTNYAIPFLLQAVEASGLKREDVLGLVITHVHLDHAGGAGLFLKEFPNATLYAHPRAARHAIDPRKLVESATAVYGQAFMEARYGQVLPCEASRVVVVEDGDSIPFQGTLLPSKHTRGHANHHLVVIEPESKTLFSGDAFGVSYPSINQKHGPIILASTSPTDFDGEAAIETVEWIANQALNQVALTHFGFLSGTQIQKLSRDLVAELRHSIALVSEIQNQGLSEDQVFEKLQKWTKAHFATQNIELDSDDLRQLEIDFRVNAQGLHFAANRAKPA